jgi:5-methylcytosine-specific restriction protein A
MKQIFQETLANYGKERQNPFKNNPLALKLRTEFPAIVNSIVGDNQRYKVVGSSGKGGWTECPWIAIFDKLITLSAQSGYYPVYLFTADMTGVYLSLNQGVTEILKDYKKNATSVLKLNAENYRAKLKFKPKEFHTNISLNSDTKNSRLYEAGNILSKHYPAENLPTDVVLRQDLLYFLKIYNQLIVSDNKSTDDVSNTVFEKKKLRLHWRIERNTVIANKVKKLKGYVCEVCTFKFTDTYGPIGANFIEAHHLTPIATLDIGSIKIDLEKDFAVLCSNCHSMIHKMDNPSDLLGLKEIINNNFQKNPVR